MSQQRIVTVVRRAWPAAGGLAGPATLVEGFWRQATLSQSDDGALQEVARWGAKEEGWGRLADRHAGCNPGLWPASTPEDYEEHASSVEAREKKKGPEEGTGGRGRKKSARRGRARRRKEKGVKHGPLEG